MRRIQLAVAYHRPMRVWSYHPRLDDKGKTGHCFANHAQITDLLAMTTHLYRASAEGLAKAAAPSAITLAADALPTPLQRNPA